MDIDKMNIIEQLAYDSHLTKQTLAEQLNFSEEKMNLAIDELVEKGYLDADLALTEKGHGELDKRKPKNAIILAAGFGMRMVPINTKAPKGLLEVQGQRLIERLIRQLHEAGIKEIDIVVGFLSEKFDYLTDKYGVNLVYNADYATKNNIHSLGLVADKINNTYIVPSDLWCQENPFSEQELYSWYAVSEKEDEESTVKVNDANEFVKVADDQSGNQMIGIAYLLEEEASLLRENLKQMCKDSQYDEAFWEEALFTEEPSIHIQPRVFPKDAVVEINTYEQLRSLDNNSESLNTSIIQLIAEQMNMDEENIKNITVLKKGMTNRSFQFTVDGERYIMRIPGEGTDQLIDRHQEYQIYQLLKDSHLTDEVVYMSPEKGYKITKFWDSARECDPFDQTDVERCMETLRNFHDKKLEVPHAFDLFEKINFYEKLWDGQESMFEDYAETKEKVFSLKKIIDSLPKEWILSHIDAVPDNFLLVNGEVRLIDWEYASMQDPHVDIAMFAIYSMYNREEIDRLIDTYFKGECSDETRMKIYAYVSIAGLLWSNWCEYKRFYGVDFGEYSLQQYRYAKEYYDIVMNEFIKENESF